MIYPTYLPAQTAIDRARTSAQNGMRRAKADLDKMQAARRKAEQPVPVLQVEPNPVPVATQTPEPEEPAPTIRTQSQPVPQPSPAPTVPESTDSLSTGDPRTSKKAA
jgi:cell division septation protein DedD